MEQHTLIPIVHVLMIRDNKVLLIRPRAIDGKPSLLVLPNGNLNDGEKLAQAATRVIKDEVEVDAVAQDFTLAHVMRVYDTKTDVINFFMETSVWNSQATVGYSGRNEEIIWVDMDNPPENTVPNVYDFLKYCYPQARQFSELGWGKNRIAKKYTKVTWFD